MFGRLTARLALLSLLLTLLLPYQAYAAATPSPPIPTEGINLQISPLPIQLTTPPGTSISTDLRIRNAGSQNELLQVRLLKVTEDDNGEVHLSNPGPNDEWAKWVSFDRPTFEAPPNDWQDIKMTVNVPKTAAFGYYFAVEYLRASDVGPQPGKAVAHGAVATFILLNADAPGAKRQAEVESFVADHHSYEFLPVTFTVKLHNTGNVHVAPTGNIFILKGNKQVDVLSVNSGQGNVLPGGSRFFTASWTNGFPVYEPKVDSSGQPVVNKQGQPETNLTWSFAHANRLRFGHYTAHLVMSYDNGQRDVPLEASVQFWVVPWRLVAGLVLILVFMGIGLWVTFKQSARLMNRGRRHV